MGRVKTSDESLRARFELAERLVALRIKLYGERGAPELARRLGVPCRTWYNYERGCTVPAQTILQLIVLTSVEARWLLDGGGSMFSEAEGQITSHCATSVDTILNKAVQLLQSGMLLLEEQEPKNSTPNRHSRMPQD